jgi:hypothetical protein
MIDGDRMAKMKARGSYGRLELLYAEPFAEALVGDLAFRSWVLKQTIFANFADEAKLLHREMLAKRSPRAKSWWRSHYSESCRCFGCSGQETDLLAIFETATDLRFALHVEVKHPDDKFDKDGNQAASYPARARCWVTNPPPNVLPHTLATTALLCSALKLPDYAAHLGHFAVLISFEDVATKFPNASAKVPPARNPK